MLTFASTTAGSAGPALDNVSISGGLVPEPTTWAMMVAGFGFIGFGMRRIVDTDALVESERRYRLLAENTSDVVYLLDRDMRFSWWSASVESVTGYNSDELIGRPHLDLVHADDAATVAATFAERYGATVGTRFRFRVASGDYRWMSANGRWATDEQGGVLGLVVGIRDIHEQVATESALAEREARYRLLADNASDVVLLNDDLSLLSYLFTKAKKSNNTLINRERMFHF